MFIVQIGVGRGDRWAIGIDFSGVWFRVAGWGVDFYDRSKSEGMGSGLGVDLISRKLPYSARVERWKIVRGPFMLRILRP